MIQIEKLNFYEVKEEYLDYLKQYEDKIPNNNNNQHVKFFCGVVIDINGYKYYAPLSSKTIKQQTSIIIYDQKKEISSIKFSFMIPVPEMCLSVKSIKNEKDEKYKRLLMKEYNYCKKHKYNIYKIANKTYKIGKNKEHKLHDVCCNFELLENLHDIYINENENTDPEVAAE